jgi:hypothetical protein
VDETTGALTSLPNFPLLTGGNGKSNGLSSELLTIDRKNLRLFAINDDSNTVSAFTIDPATGALTALPFSPINLPTPHTTINTGAHWSTVAVRPSGFDSLLVVGDIGGAGGQLASFRITTVTATPGPGSPFRTLEANPLSTVFSRDGLFVYTGGGSSSKIAGFRVISANGDLAPVGPELDAVQSNPAAYVTDATGRLFATSRPFSNLLVFTIASNGRLIATPFNSSSPRSGAGFAAQGVLHPDGFYMVSGRSSTDKVSVHKINGAGSATTLTAVGAFSSGGTAINLLALNQSGKFLFAGNTNTHNLTTFAVDGAGALAIRVTQPANTLCVLGTPCGLMGLNGIAYLPPRTTTMTIDAPAITCGADATVVVNVNSPAGNPTGDVLLTVDGGAPMTRPLIGDPSATFTIPAPTVGTHSLVATFAAQNGFASISATGTLVVNVATTSLTMSAPEIFFGQNGTVIVKVSSPAGNPAGNVALTVDGGLRSAQFFTQALSAGSATFTIPAPTVGGHSLLATFAAQGCFESKSDTGTLVVKVAPTRMGINAPEIIFGLNGIVTVKVISGFATPSGNVSLTVDGGPAVTKTLVGGLAVFKIPVPAVGIHPLAANFPAQGGFGAKSTTGKLTVKKAKTTITKISAPSVTIAGPPVGQTAPVTVTVTPLLFSETPPSGNVSLKLDFAAAMTQPLSGGSVTFNLVMPPAGIHFLKATFLGEPGVYAPSTSPNTLFIVRGAGQRVTTATIKASAITLGQNGSVSVKVSSAAGVPSGNVSLTMEHGAAMTKNLVAGSATFIINKPTAGIKSLEASFNGSVGFAPSKAIGTLVVNKQTVKP